MIDAVGLHKVYRLKKRRVTALNGVDLRVEPGEIYGVVGQSGAGKSTLLRTVNLLERPDAGTVRVAGEELTSLRGAGLRSARRRIGMVHQHFALLASRTVAGNVAFPLEVAGVGRAARRARVGELLELVGLADKARAHPSQLSGGQKQRVGIARALASRPDVLLSDEATSALDPATTDSILALLRRLRDELGLTILLITHEMDVIKRICDSAAIMEAGEFRESGRVLDLIGTPGSLLARSLFPLPDRGGPDTVVVTYPRSYDEPLMSELTRRFDVDVNILGGGVEQVAGQSVGRLIVDLRGPRRSQALSYLAEHGLLVEEAGQ